MKLIVGLGNPGKQYDNSRHNAGFLFLDALAQELALPEFQPEKKFLAEVSQGRLNSSKIILAKPDTFMNESGVSVQKLKNFFKLTETDIIIVHDDKDLPLGEFKIQDNRGDAGHRGVASVIAHLRSKNFTRIRLGVAGDEKKMSDTAKFVLGKFGFWEKKKLKTMIKEAVQETKHLL